ncbi:MAG: ankyrin repeat domain-containing protein [Bacteroidales bacterium]|nr:ankyrin repeat domain-containing protein [Bacteroidales bacterium]
MKNARLVLKNLISLLIFSLATGFSINAQDYDAGLLRALDSKNLSDVKEALDKGADPNIRDNFNQSALIMSVPTNGQATDNDYEIIKLLLEKGADPNFTSNLGSTALFPACYYGYKKIVQLLLDYGADPTVITNIGGGATAIDKARDNGFTEILEMLNKYAAKADIIAKIDANTKLTYNVNAMGNKYNFIVDVIQTGPEIVFGWKMTLENRTDKEGTITISDEAAKTATGMYNYFQNGEINLIDKTSVWISKKSFSSLRTGVATELNTGSGTKLFYRKKATADNQIKINGYDRPLNVIYVESEDKSEKLWILNNPNMPVILKMDLGWTIEIASIEPPNK